ncbi:MAG: 50S ribosomal protein L9 [Tissierellia bacterium]|nr:50S ribosomal protein L9 [Tissierellia bacterium]
MKIILLKDVEKMGKAGDLVDAKAGYARNYLFPRKMAVEANEENMKSWKEQKAQEEANEAARLEEAQELQTLLESKEVTLKAKGGEGGRLFGAITNQDIAKAIEAQMGKKLDKKKIDLSENIKTTGSRTVVVKLHPEVVAQLKVSVEAE